VSGGYPAQIPLGQLLLALVAVLARLGQDPLDLGHQRRVAPEVAGGGLGAGGVTLVGAAEQRPRGRQRIPGVVASGEWVVARRLAGVFVDEGPRHSV
jgi:hypothetical protein